MKNTVDIGKEEMFKAIRKLYNEYNLPRLNISQNEWLAFFNLTSKIFDDKELCDDYPVALNIVIRRALNMALIDNAKEVTINYLIDALCDLSVFHIYSNEISNLQDEIKCQIEINKVKKYTKN